jgi:hypothetical protein
VRSAFFAWRKRRAQAAAAKKKLEKFVEVKVAPPATEPGVVQSWRLRFGWRIIVAYGCGLDSTPVT